MLFSERCVWFAKLVNAGVAVALLFSLLSLFIAPADSPAWWKGNDSCLAWGEGLWTKQ